MIILLFVTILLYIGLSQTAKLELLGKEPRGFWEAWGDVALVGNRASVEVSHQFREEVSVDHAYTTRPSSTKPSTSRGSSRPELSFLRWILHAQSSTAMSINNELFAT
jgi:hypothetical protein